MKRFTNPPEPLPPSDPENPENHLAVQIVKAVTDFTRDTKRRVYGTMNIETENQEGMNVFYDCFPGGDFFLWYIENGWFTMTALVDEKYKMLARNPVTEMDIFYDRVKAIGEGLSAKHGYPIDIPKPPKPKDENEDDNKEPE